MTINPNQSSFIRVGYESFHYQRLAEALATDQLDSAEKVGLISDVFAIALSGDVSTTDGLQLISGINRESSSHVWETIGAELAGVRTHLLGEEHQQLLAPLVSNLIEHHYQRLGWQSIDGESEADQLIRTVVVALALRYDLFDATDTAGKLWQQLVESDTPITPNLRSSVYGFVARNGEITDYDQLLELYKKQILNEEKLRFARAITTLKNPDAAKRSLELIKTDVVRQQDIITWLAGLMRNPHVRSTVWDWYQADWDWLYKQFNQGHIYSYLAQILGFFNNETYVKEIRNFFEDKDTRGLNVTLEQAIEQIETKSAWIKRDAEPTRQWLRQNYK